MNHLGKARAQLHLAAIPGARFHEGCRGVHARLAREWEEFLVLPGPSPVPPPVFSSSPRILRPGSRQISPIQSLSGRLQWQSGRRTRRADAFSWPPKAASSNSRSMEPLIVIQAVAGWPLTVRLSCSSRQPRRRTEPLRDLTGGHRWLHLRGRLSSPPRPPAHWPSGQNSIQFTRKRHTTLVWWDHPGVINTVYTHVILSAGLV